MKTPVNHPELAFVVPTMMIPTVKIPQPDGSVLIKPGKPIEVGDDVTVTEAAKILGLSSRQVQKLCQDGNFNSAHKPGGTPKSTWRISRNEVLARKTGYQE